MERQQSDGRAMDHSPKPSAEAIREAYSSKIAVLETEKDSLKRKSGLCLAGKLFFFAAAVVFICFAVSSVSFRDIAFSVLSAALYIVSYIADSRLRDRISRLESLQKTCRNELAYLDGDFTPFGKGEEYADPDHEYACDLDIFGESSLFQRIDRTVTSGGRDLLAGLLKKLPGDSSEILSRMEAVQELSSMEMLDWRTDFISSPKADSSLEALSGYIGRESYGRFLTVSHVPFVMVAVTWASLAAGVCGVAYAWAVFGIMVMVQLMTAAIIGRSSQNAAAGADALHKSYSAYLKLLKMIRGTDFRSVKLKGLKQELFGQDADCDKAFRELSGILNLFDQRGGYVMYYLLNGTLQYDVMLIRLFIRWGRRYFPYMERWLGAIAGFDALTSLAVYAFNSPGGTMAQISEDPDYVVSAKDVFHPFLSPDKAVPNDFEIKRHNIFIVTGANMAGKSTFLRTIGVNYILASNGVPVCASSFRFSVVSLFSGMRTSDNLSRDISYFNAELRRLKQLIDHVKANDFTLIILDEILKGTNSKDKLQGSIMFLDYISGFNVSAVVATHDLELAGLADKDPGLYRNLCFEIGLSEDICYTYKIQDGVARNLNASYLLSRILNTDRDKTSPENQETYGNE